MLKMQQQYLRLIILPCHFQVVMGRAGLATWLPQEAAMSLGQQSHTW